MKPSERVFSTYVEVIPLFKVSHLTVQGFLHVCGGDPYDRIHEAAIAGFSPRMWR